MAFMVVVYLAFGLVVERYSRRPGSQLKAFARTLCSPIARPVARFLAPGASDRRVLAVSLVAVALVWAAIVALDVALRRP
ncbi:MAG TPA: hypothetical protein VFK90_09405 [Anaeromyxobacter sp.]|nr:hypothetical protein [Anaeromyxobacter sp.]